MATAVTNQTYSNNGGNNMNEKVVKPKIHIDTEPFVSTLKSRMTTTLDLAGEINQIFRPIFSDYEGCTITPDNAGMLHVELFFKDKGKLDANDKRIKNLESAVTPNKAASPIDRIYAMNARNRNKAYVITEDTKEVLSNFIPSNKKDKDGNKVIEWKNIVTEVTEPTQYGYQVYVKISGIDITEILKEKYGDKVDGDEGAKVHYGVTVNRSLSAAVLPGTMASKYLITITQLNVKEVKRIYDDAGMGPIHGNIPIIR